MGSRHVALEWPKTTKRDAEGVEEEMSGQEVYPSPADWGSVVAPPAGQPQPLMILSIISAILCDFMHVLVHFEI